jgi:hypothetical protein
MRGARTRTKRIRTCRPTASAVAGLSPVTITTRMPAFFEECWGVGGTSRAWRVVGNRLGVSSSKAATPYPKHPETAVCVAVRRLGGWTHSRPPVSPQGKAAPYARTCGGSRHVVLTPQRPPQIVAPRHTPP